MKNQTKVLVNETNTPVEIYGMNNEVRTLGHLISREYEGEQVQRHSFIDNAGNERNLGPTTTEFQMIKHTDAIEPLLREGYSVTDQSLLKGGSVVLTILKNKDDEGINDPISWDNDYWVDSQSRNSRLFNAIMVKTSIKPGTGFTYRRGYFRMICTNGLFSQILDLGHSNMNHRNFSIDRMMGQLNISRGTADTPELKGHFLGNQNGLKKTIDFLHQDIETYAQTDEIPHYLNKPISTIARFPNWYLTGLNEQLERISESQGSIYALDLVNAATNVINYHRHGESERAADRLINRVDSLTDSLSALIGSFSLS